MTKSFAGIAALFAVLSMALANCGTSGAATAGGDLPGMDLDAAIREAASQMEENIPAGTTVALVSVASSSAQLSDYILGRLEAALVGGKTLVVVDRANLDKVRAEQGFQTSGEVSDESAKSIGALLGAGAIVTGAFSDLGEVYSLTLKAIDMETATVAVSYPADIAKSTRIDALLASGGAGGTAAASAGGARLAGGQTAVPAAQSYKIGDSGPAGGLVFYDKGNSQGGWRYMEAAPAETEKSLIWSDSSKSNLALTYIGQNGAKTGNGKINTEKLMEFAAHNGGGFGWAVQYCDTLEVNGFDDWFLPSWDELNYMYGNLYMRELGGFKSRAYWSSTESGLGSRNALFINFETGKAAELDSSSRWDTTLLVRAVRQF
jgi:hypothetical protein